MWRHDGANVRASFKGRLFFFFLVGPFSVEDTPTDLLFLTMCRSVFSLQRKITQTQLDWRHVLMVY